MRDETGEVDMKRDHVMAGWLAVLAAAALLLMMIHGPAQAQTGSKPSEQLMAAAKDGNLEEVQRLIDSGAHLPGTLNSFRAIKFARDGGHGGVLELLEAGLNEYIEAGTPYDNFVAGYMDKLRTRAEEDPGSIRWSMEKRVIVGLASGFFNGLKKDPDGLMYPLGAAFDEQEFRRRFDPTFDALQEKYEVESDFDRKMRENEEAWEALIKENQAKIAEEEDDGQSEMPRFAWPSDEEGGERIRR